MEPVVLAVLESMGTIWAVFVAFPYFNYLQSTLDTRMNIECLSLLKPP
jgi:hypothetical protein